MKLIILNGPSGVGKSTIAARLHSEMTDSILIDIDELRRTIPNYQEERRESLQLSYEKARVAIETGLENGHTVIIDKAISRPDVLDSFLEIGREHGADVYEILLYADKETVQNRADVRGYRPGSLLNRDRVGELWDQLNMLKKQRTGVAVVDTTSLNPEEAYGEVSALIR